MANNVQAIQDFVDGLNLALNSLVAVRDEISAANTLWPSLDGTSKTNIHNQITADFNSAKAMVDALVVP